MEGDGAFQLCTIVESKNFILPLKQVCFTVSVNEGFADIVFHQKYENNLDEPLEIIFMMPISETFACNKIGIDYSMPDGTVESIETVVIERSSGE